jgi:transposase
MVSITRQNVGRYTYLYESESYWDKEKKRPDNKKTLIGKIDLLTGDPVYKQEYLDKLASAGESIADMKLWDRKNEARGQISRVNVSEDAIASSVIDSIKDFGVVYFLRELSEKIGLLSVLRDAMPDVWEDVFSLACYLISSDKPVMYCEEWVASNDGLDVGSMSSQRISELLLSFGSEQRNRFYQLWYDLIREREYIALDITSVSSYSDLIEASERGYNRDGENLAQVNICMLFGENSKLPVYQTIYSGSLRDVSTLKATISEFGALVDISDLMLVMDKGFFSVQNVNMLLGRGNEEPLCQFLISVPFTTTFAKNQVESERKDIDTLANVILTSGAPIRGVHKERSWNNGKKIHTHVFYNPVKAIKEKNELFGYVASLAQQAVLEPDNEKLRAEYKKYLIIRKSQRTDSGVTVSIREEVIAEELKTVGWFVLISNHIEDPQIAHDVYRMKDVVEKGFLKYKNNLGLDRLRVHGDERMQNKIFIAFTALIIASAIQNTMKERNLFKHMTFDRLILTLAKLKSATVNGKTILRPVTKTQKDIFDAFDIHLPDANKSDRAPKKRERKLKSTSAG